MTVTSDCSGQEHDYTVYIIYTVQRQHRLLLILTILFADSLNALYL